MNARRSFAAVTAVSRPNTNDVLVQIANQSVFYDSGLRNVSASLINGNTGTLMFRRVNKTVFVRFFNLTAAGGLPAYVMPDGFKIYTPGSSMVFPANSLTATGAVLIGTAGIQPFGAAIAYVGAVLSVSYLTPDDPPVSLPGVLVTSAPA